ncbi:MAG: T9SS type A sorting domain-containing protein [Ignavibacteria bacterium]|nr:T9SS type A sorting domain-containing protein [Ignavibacteria bacterium]
MAVYILDSLSGGGEQGDGDDRNSRLTNEQKTYVKDVVKNIYESERMKEENNMNRLVSEANDGNEISKLILSKKRTLKDVVQNQSPHNILEHINIVNSDIKKVFGKYHSESRNSSNIPTVYRLSQNYPNPFNPVTKINYDLPKDAKVNIVIYDILGREVKRLVNNELKTAGTYIIDFNASNYASGVYFYRIEAEEPGGNKFVDSKKMVLIK